MWNLIFFLQFIGHPQVQIQRSMVHLIQYMWPKSRFVYFPQQELHLSRCSDNYFLQGSNVIYKMYAKDKNLWLWLRVGVNMQETSMLWENLQPDKYKLPTAETFWHQALSMSVETKQHKWYFFTKEITWMLCVRESDHKNFQAYLHVQEFVFPEPTKNFWYLLLIHKCSIGNLQKRSWVKMMSQSKQ